MKTKTCPACNGKGYSMRSDMISVESSSCPCCRGRGTLTAHKPLKPIPAKATVQTLDHINAAMEILAHRIAHEPSSVVGSSDREVYKLLREALPAIGALIELHADSECYCPENLAVKTVCPFCRAKNQMKIVKVGDKGNVLVEFFTKFPVAAGEIKP